MKVKILLSTVAVLTILGIAYYLIFTMEEQLVTSEQLISGYQYKKLERVDLRLEKIEERLFSFTYQSYDGSLVRGQIGYPDISAEKYPVLIGVSAMGRGYFRWWTDSYKGRPTVTRVNEIAKLANQKGNVVIAIDARYHGTRKDPNRTLRSIMNDLTIWGDKTTYEEMIMNTVLDHRVLLDWIEQQDDLDSSTIGVVGYSMGGQISLLLSAIDQRITKVASIVPPFIDDRMAMVAPKNVTSMLANKTSVLMLSSDDDENSSEDENDFLFNSINNSNKKHIQFEGSHILPEGYETSLQEWL